MNNPRVVVSALAVVVLWASAFPAIQVAVPALGVAGLSEVRLGVAALALLALAPFLGVRRPAARDLPLIAVCGFLGMAAYQILLNWGELAVPAGTASIVVAAAPLVSLAIAVPLFGERLTGWKIAGSLTAIAGVLAVCLARAGVSMNASVWIVAGAMAVQGSYHPLTKPLLKKYSGLEVATYGMVAGFIMLLPTVPWGLRELGGAGLQAWLAAVYLGLLPSALGFVLWGYAVARLSVTVSTSVLYLVPPVAVLVAFLWLGQLPHAAELVGGAVVVLGVVILSQGEKLQLRRRLRRMTQLARLTRRPVPGGETAGSTAGADAGIP